MCVLGLDGHDNEGPVRTQTRPYSEGGQGRQRASSLRTLRSFRYPALHPPVHPSILSSFHPSVHPLSIHPSSPLSVHPSILSPICPSILSSICPFIHPLSIHTSIYTPQSLISPFVVVRPFSSPSLTLFPSALMISFYSFKNSLLFSNIFLLFLSFSAP